MNSSLTASQKRLHQAIRDMGCILPGAHEFGANGWQMHHIYGSKAKHNKVNIGEYAVLLLPWELHDVHSNHELNVTHHKNAFEEHYGMQKELCVWQYDKLFVNYVFATIGRGAPPKFSTDDMPSEEVLMAIMDYHK